MQDESVQSSKPEGMKEETVQPSKRDDEMKDNESVQSSKRDTDGVDRAKSIAQVKKLQSSQTYVIYPGNIYMRYWDAMMLVLILFYCFTIPYQLLVSGGVNLLVSFWWFIVTVIMNSAFFVDTFLPFFRAYRDPQNGRMIIDPKSIRRSYLRGLFWWNLASNIPTTIIFYLAYTGLVEQQGEDIGDCGSGGGVNTNLIGFIKIFDFLKLLRLRRASRILETSDFVREFKEKRSAYTLRFWAFVFLIAVTAHWFACIWCGVAYLQVGTFCAESMLIVDNWIGNWYKGNFEDGGLDPLGWFNDANRYVLSLFWAIQTITSIGYGNIAPFTPVEWWIASIMQLAAGVCWAYVIGGLVGVVTATEVKSELYRERIDEANRLIHKIYPEESERKRVLFRREEPKRSSMSLSVDHDNSKERKRLAKKIRRYIYMQNERPSNMRYVSTMEDYYPVLGSLPPDLQRTSAWMVVQNALNRVPYLSSRYLSQDEQSRVAQKCIILEFPLEDRMYLLEDGVADYGRGIVVQQSGLLWRSANALCSSRPILSGGVVGGMSVLLEDDEVDGGNEGPTVVSLSFVTAIFIPRDAVMSALERNPNAWTGCARWSYLGAQLIRRARIELKKGDARTTK